MSFNGIRENKILAKISESTEYVLGNQRYLKNYFTAYLLCNVRYIALMDFHILKWQTVMILIDPKYLCEVEVCPVISTSVRERRFACCFCLVGSLWGCSIIQGN